MLTRPGSRTVVTLAAMALAASAGCAAPAGSPGGAFPDGAAQGGAPITQQIVFEMTGNRPASPDASSELGLVNLDGSGLRQLTHDGTFKFLPHFSPDGTRITYTRYAVGGYGSPDAQADVAVLDLATGVETMVTSGGASVQGTWSPDGKRLAYLAGASLATGVDSMWIVNADGTGRHEIASAAGTPDDVSWGDIAWSSQDWILFTVIQNVDGCFKVRTDKILPDGSSRTKVSDGGPNCTPDGLEQSGDADPGWSPDGKTIYSSRGFPFPPDNAPAGGGSAVRRLYAFSSDAWAPGKVETDLSLPSEPNCIEGVPKVSPDGTHILESRGCFDDSGMPAHLGLYVTDTTGSYRTFVTPGFGGDWNPVAQ